MNRRFVSCFFTCLLLVCGLIQFHSVSGQSIFVIEAEDFNYGSGQRRSQADTMPYLGGAYNGLGAVANVDYFQPANEGSANEYRVGETPNVPMTQNPDFDREAWQVTTNYRIGWTDNGDWYNYTRVFPNAHYQVYAALSFDGTAPGQLKGSMQKVTSGANTTSQTVVQLGTFDAPGSGGWGRNALVPLKSADGTIADVELNGLTTLRFTAVSGDIDYYKFVPLVPPQITEHPANLTVMEGEPATFSVKVSNTGPMSYQWQSNRVNIAGATSSVYTIPVTPLAADGAKYRCVLTNSLGTATSDEALLSVNPDSIKPAIANVQNIGTTTLMVVFSEPVEATTATASANYQISNGISVSAVAFGSDTRTVLLTTSALVYGTTYSLTVNNVKDRAVTPNTIVPNSTRTFLAVEYAPVEIGNPAQPGTVEPVPGGFNVTGGGLDIGGTSDQFHFEYQLRTGNFDVKVRLQSFSPSDMWAKAGLMARTSLTPNSAFAAALATPATVGCFFESRVSSGGNATLAGTFPVNYPETWLRLQRSGSTFTGYASLDGQNWTQLGSVSISMPNTIYFGPVVSSHHASTTARVEFRDIAPNIGGTVGNFTPNREPLGPSSRRTGLVISEIMYHPKDRSDEKDFEFIEIFNASPLFENLSGYRLTGAIDFQFPSGTILPAGGFLVVAKQPDVLRSVYGISNVLGPYTNSLPNSSGTIRLRTAHDAILLEANYESEPPWPAAADGLGHSLVLSQPSYGEGQRQAWAASEWIGGSPGSFDAIRANPQANVVINEFLAHTDDPQLDFIELYNHSLLTVDLSGCWLTDDPSTNKFRIPDDTRLAGRGFLHFDQNTLGFRLDASGETIFLVNSNQTRVLDAIRFGAQENGVSSGRSPDGAATIRRLAMPTPGTANGPWRVENIVITEIMYHPISGDSEDEFIELFNRSSSTIDLSGWRFTDGIDFRFPKDAVLGPGSYLVVAKNVSRLLSNYAHLTTNSAFGDFEGSLSNGGERIALARPDQVLSTNEIEQVVTNTIFIDVAEVTYGSGGRWGRWADGGGSSLELIDVRADPFRAASWADSDETRKSRWTTATFTGRLDNGNDGYPPNRLHILMQGAGECLVDDVEVFKTVGANLVSNGGFESGTVPGATGWSFFGNHSTSAVEATGAAVGARCLHVRGQGDGDTGINSIRTALAAGLANGNTATIRAQVRWLAGWPQILFRTRGSWIEMSAQMDVPKNLGTPALPNSRSIANAGPAIFDVTHNPPLPRPNQTVVVTARVSDADGIGAVSLRYRVDPNVALTTLTMRDDGLSGDAVAGDGIYSATLPRQNSGVLVAFRVEARDAAATPATTVFPANAPAGECLVRWDDPQPFGNLARYHLWSTRATQDVRGQSGALNNTLRDATLVYGNSRIIYNVGFRDKGSPYHGGQGDLALTVPQDDLLLGATDRVFASTGNGGSEETGLRGQLASWLAGEMGIPFLHGHYMRLYWNGGEFRNVMEDLEQPNHNYAEKNFREGGEGDLYKIAVWFEFNDDNSGFGAIGATLQPFTTTGGAYKLARYRWNFQRRSNDGNANNLTNIFDLVTAANSTTDYVNKVLNQVDIEEWMRVFAYHRIMGNWDSYAFSVGQNMYAYKRPGYRWVLMPWDIDFVFGLGAGVNDGLWGGQDPVVNRMFDTPAFRRALWRAYLEAVSGPLQSQNYLPQIDARRTALLDNGIGGLSDTKPIKDYIEQRRNFIISQIQAADAASFTVNGGNFTTNRPLATLTGRAPFAIANIEVNGIPYPATWSDQNTYSISIPLTQMSNVLTIVGVDRFGKPVPGASRTITVTYTGVLQRPEDYVVINEIMYNAAAPNASFIELYNTSTTTTFDLSNFRLDGTGFTFPEGTLLGPVKYLLVVSDAAGFAAAHGASTPIAGVFPGTLDNGGETLKLIRPGATETEDVVIDQVRYDDDPPWPAAADGQGPSLQLIDASRDNWRVANWGVTATNATNRATPGNANAVRAFLDPFPLLWINEVLPNNAVGIMDNAGDREPWIELYNAGTTTIDLGGYYLSDTYTNLTRWQFPIGTTLAAGQFLVIWADNEPAESTSTSLHTNFRLNATNGSVALSRLQFTQPAVMDYLDYNLFSPDRSFGSHPDDQPQQRRIFHFATPGASNNPAAAPISVFINEWMAGNTRVLADPADDDFEDWIELYNAGNVTADLSGYFLSDTLTNKTQFVIPAGTLIPPNGYLLVWADSETGQNGRNNDLHTNFRLALAGEEIVLTAPDGSLVDYIKFNTQTNDISEGRVTDGAEPPFVFFDVPSPREQNVFQSANQPPVLAAIGNKIIPENQTFTLTASATDPEAPAQALTFLLTADAPAGASIDPVTGVFSWTPTEAQGPGSYTFTVRVVDNGTPNRSDSERITITVAEINRAPVLADVPDQTVNEGSLLALNLVAADNDTPVNTLTFSLDAGAPSGAVVDPVTGVLTWTPSEAFGGSTIALTVRVTDNGDPALTDSKTFRVTVNEVNNVPVLDPIQAQAVSELQTILITVSATDPDTPASPIRYSLDLAPEGALINATTGEITWTPTEAQGPTNAVFIVRATETEPPGLSDARTFAVQVNEVNTAPTLEPLADYDLLEGKTVRFTARAADSDLPAQKLSFTLAPGAPSAATIDAASGEFSWLIDPDFGASTNRIMVTVTDDSSPALSASQTFEVVVRPQVHVVINEIMYQPKVDLAEYVELFNTSARTSIDLSGVQLAPVDFVIPNGVQLAPGAYLILARYRTAYAAAYGGTGMILGDFRLPLSKTGGTIALIKPGATPDLDVVLDEVTYSNRLPWAVEAAGAGPSLQLIDPTRDNSRVGNWTTGSPFTTSAPQSLVVMTNSWKFFEQGDPGAGWNELGFDDGAWAPGQALLYVENANLPAAKNTPLALGQMAYYFRTKFNFNGNPEGTTFKLTTIIDDGAVFYLNGKELYRLGMPPGDVVFATPSGRTVGDAAMEGPFTIQTNLLRQGENVFAVEVHQPGASSDIVMGAALEVIEVQRAGYTPLTENSVRANIPEFPTLWINEVLPQNTAGLADGQGEREPWIELYNSGPTPIPLGGLYLTDNYAALTRWAFPPDVVIQPGQFLLVWADGESGESSAAELHTNFRLNATSGSIALARVQNGKPAVVDYIDYAGLNADMSFGSIPDGQSQLRQAIVAPTPNSANQNEPINRAPTLGSILNQQILTGQTLTVQLTATDPDPGQTLRFELVEGPAGAALDSGSGLLSWTPTQAQIGQFTFTLRATDNGSPPLSDSRSFNVTVTKPAEDLRIIEVTRLISGGVRLTWTSEPQRTYRVQYASTVPTATWTPLGAAITATGATASFDDNPGDHAVRFYRIVAE